MPRTPLMAGNWKMNLNHVEAVGLLQKLAWTLEDKKHDPDKSEVIVLPPFTDLRTVQTMVDGDRLEIGYGAQDVSAYDAGAYTGDISADMLVKLGCRYVVVGHSERRRFHGEDDNIVNAKTLKAVSRGIVPIVCVGERLAVRQAVAPGARYVAPRGGRARGPHRGAGREHGYRVRARVGNRHRTGGHTDDAEEVCAAIRGWISDGTVPGSPTQIRILYGGSVNATNVAALMAQEDIDGCLVGAASLKVDEFAAIARFYEMP